MRKIFYVLMFAAFMQTQAHAQTYTPASPHADRDATAAFRLPANTANANGMQLYLGHALTFGGDSVGVGEDEHGDSIPVTIKFPDTNFTTAAVVLPVFESGAVGFFVRGNVDEQTFGMSLARYNRLHAYGLGGFAAITRYSEDSNEYDDLKFSGGLDFRVDPSNRYSARVYYQNWGDVSTEIFGVAANYFPLRGRGDDDEQRSWDVDLGFGAQSRNDTLNFGASLQLEIANRFLARTSYELATEGDIGIEGLRVGAGVRINNFTINADVNFANDEAIRIRTATLGATYEIISIKNRNVNENLELAHENFERRKFRHAAMYADRALEKDRTNWNAQALEARANARLARQSKNEIAIIYGGSADGAVVPFPPSHDALGGMSRYAAVVENLRGESAIPFAIDASNLFDAASDPRRVEMTARYFDVMPFDAITPGPGAIAAGLEIFAPIAQQRDGRVVITNLIDNAKEQANISDGVLLSRDNYGIYVVNIIAASVLREEDLNSATIFIDRIRAQLENDPLAANANLRVAVIYGSLEDIERLTAEFQNIDVVIAPSLEERVENHLTINNAKVISAGNNNRFVGRLLLQYDDGDFRGRPRIVNEFFPILQEIAPHPLAEQIVGLVTTDVVVDETDIVVARPAHGVIPHLTNRDTTFGNQAFIKAVSIENEYNISSGTFANRQPIYSNVSNRAAFVFGAERETRLRMVDLAMMNGRNVSEGGSVTGAAFSPVENFLYYIEAERGTNANGVIKKTRMYMFDALTVLESDGRERADLSISNDGATILFSAREPQGRWQIFAIDSSAITPPVRITHVGAFDARHAAQSPDGRYIAYLSDSGNVSNRMNLWIYERGGGHTQITTDANVSGFAWCDESETIYFTLGATLHEIFALDMIDRTFRRVITTADNIVKSWSETGVRFIRYDGEPRIVYTREYIDGTRRLYWYNPTNNESEKLFITGDHNEWTE